MSLGLAQRKGCWLSATVKTREVAKSAFTIGIVIGLAAVVLFFLRDKPPNAINNTASQEKVSGKRLDTNKFAISPSPIQEISQSDNETSDKEEDFFDPIFRESKEWLDQFCPPLSIEEENRLLETYGRTPSVLIALASMNADRTEEYLGEALDLYPDDPNVLMFAFENRRLLEIEPEELLNDLKRAAPEDALPNIALAEILLSRGDEELARSELLDAYGKNLITSKNNDAMFNEKVKLLKSAGRQDTEALARASATTAGSGNVYGTIFSHVDKIIQSDQFDNDTQKLAALLIDTSQQLQSSSTIADSQFLLWQEELLIEKFSNYSDEQIVVQFPDSPEKLIQALQSEIQLQENFLKHSRALVPFMSQLPDESLADFLNIFAQYGELEAFLWVEQNSPAVFEKIDGLEIARWVDSSYWR